MSDVKMPRKPNKTNEWNILNKAHFDAIKDITMPATLQQMTNNRNGRWVVHHPVSGPRIEKEKGLLKKKVGHLLEEREQDIMENNVDDAVSFALEGNPVEFEGAIKASLSDRILDAIEARRVEVASKIMGTPEYYSANPEQMQVDEPNQEQE